MKYIALPGESILVLQRTVRRRQSFNEMSAVMAIYATIEENIMIWIS